MRWPFVWRRDYDEAMELIAEQTRVIRQQTRIVDGLKADLSRLRARFDRTVDLGDPPAPGPLSPPLRQTPLSVREADEAAMRRLRGEGKKSP